jgi:hypothetical protein
MPITSAIGDPGDCVKVYGKGGKAANGYARVCLEAFDSETGTAKLRVTKQKRNSAPHNVYVQAGFAFGGFNTGVSRLGPNSPRTYTKRIETSAAEPEGVIVKLCYDKTLKKDPCFKSKVSSGTDWPSAKRTPSTGKRPGKKPAPGLSLPAAPALPVANGGG